MWKAAIDSFAERFTGLGLQPPKTSVVRGKGHDELWRLLHDQRRRVIAAIGYGTVASEKRSLWASRSYRGNHAVYLRAGTLVDGTRKVPTYDPLADGRFTGCPNGRRLWPFWLVKAASGDVRDGKGRRLYPAEDRWIGLVVSKARPSASQTTVSIREILLSATQTCQTSPSSSRSSPTPPASSRTTSLP